MNKQSIENFTWGELFDFHGYEVEYCIKGNTGIGKLSVNKKTESIYICQNKINGLVIPDKLGFRFSYVLENCQYNGNYFVKCIKFIYLPEKTFNKEELLEEANRKYPVGTIVKDPVFLDTYTVRNGVYLFKEVEKIDRKGQIVIVDNSPLSGNYLYVDGKWAEIVSKPEEKEPKSLIGRYLKALVDYPNGGIVKKGEYGKIIDNHFAHFPSQKNYACGVAISKLNDSNTIYDGKYELMPEGFNPYEFESDIAISLEKIKKQIIEKYPIGTCFRDLVNNEILIVKNHNFDTFGKTNQLYVPVKYNKLGNKTARIWKEGIFAEIISKPFLLKHLEKNPDRISFYVKYCEDFTEDLYNKLNIWCSKNTKGKIRDFDDSYVGLIKHKYYLFDNWGISSEEYDPTSYSYGVDNNVQTCLVEYSIKDIKNLIDYKEEIPEYVECTDGNMGSHYTGKVYKVENGKISCEKTGTPTTWSGFNSGGFNFKISTKEAYDKQQKDLEIWNIKVEHSLTEQEPIDPMIEIQEEAKKKFPIGCEFINTNGNKHILEKDEVTYEIEGNRIYANNGKGCLYQNGKWATLVEKKKEEYIPQVGDWVVILNTAKTSTSALKNRGKVVQVIKKSISCFKSNLPDCGGIYDYEVRKAEPHEIPKENNAMNKEPEIDSWCVKATKENQELLKQNIQFFTTRNYEFCDFGKYYGITKKGKFNIFRDSLNFDKVLTTEEFCQKFNITQSSKYELLDTFEVTLIDKMKPLQEQYNEFQHQLQSKIQNNKTKNNNLQLSQEVEIKIQIKKSKTIKI